MEDSDLDILYPLNEPIVFDFKKIKRDHELTENRILLWLEGLRKRITKHKN